MTKIIETIAILVSAGAFTFGAVRLFPKENPKYFKLFVWAAGCYTLEELWVLVTLLFGNGGGDDLVTVRLVGLFGCLCFMLSANANEFDRLVDEGKNRSAGIISLIAPAILIGLYAVFVVESRGLYSVAKRIIGFICLSPALFAAYFNAKHLLLPKDTAGLLKATRGIDAVALLFYVMNFAYPTMSLFVSKIGMSLYDLSLGILMGVLILLCRKGARVWKTLI